jgi:hypothetical protein
LAGLIFQNQGCINRVYQLRIFPLIDAGLHRVYPVQSNQLTNAPEIRRTTLYNILARLLIPAIGKSAVKTAHAQTILDEAVVACALERFRLLNGRYPENLQSLVPRFIEKVLPDVIDGEPLRYRRTDGGQFVLYSIGWNGRDDGGVADDRAKTSTERDERGDWAWDYPMN